MEKGFMDYVKVGMFVVFSIAVLVGGYLWISSEKRMKATNFYYIKLPRATLISRGTKVLVLGVQKGKVEDVIIFEDGVLLKVGLKDYVLPEGSYANIITPNALGSRMVDIIPGVGNPLPPGDTIPGRDSPSFDEILYSVQEIASKADKLLSSVDTVLINLNLVLSGTKMEIERLRLSLDNSLMRLNVLIDTATLLLAESGNRLDTLMDNANRLMEVSTESVDSISREIILLSERSREILEEIRVELDSIKYRGTLGRLMSDETLYMELENTVKKLQELIEDIKRNPAKYINVEIF